MYLTVKQQVKHLSKEDYCSIRELCHIAKNLTNEAIYNVRQYYFTVHCQVCCPINNATHILMGGIISNKKINHIVQQHMPV